MVACAVLLLPMTALSALIRLMSLHYTAPESASEQFSSTGFCRNNTNAHMQVHSGSLSSASQHASALISLAEQQTVTCVEAHRI